MLTLAVASQDNKMEHELCMARELARSPAKVIRLLFHLKKSCGGVIIPSTGLTEITSEALLFSIFTCLIYVLEPVTDNKDYRRIQVTRLEGEKHRSV